MGCTTGSRVVGRSTWTGDQVQVPTPKPEDPFILSLRLRAIVQQTSTSEERAVRDPVDQYSGLWLVTNGVQLATDGVHRNG